MIKNWVKTENTELELMPFCHTTKWANFEKILKSGVLSNDFSKFPDPEKDKIKTKKVVYLFYGLPFYIYETGKGDKINIETTDDFPIGIIFKPELVNQLNNCYPFDTGAFFNDKFQGVLNIEDSELETIFSLDLTDGVEIRQLTHRYYSNNCNYCYGTTDITEAESKDTKEEKLIHLLNNKSDSRLDMRTKAFEIHSNKSIDLKDNLFAIVLPKRRSDRYSGLIKELEEKHTSIEIIKYRDFSRGNHESFRTLILDTVMSFYEDNFPKFLTIGNEI